MATAPAGSAAGRDVWDRGIALWDLAFLLAVAVPAAGPLGQALGADDAGRRGDPVDDLALDRSEVAEVGPGRDPGGDGRRPTISASATSAPRRVVRPFPSPVGGPLGGSAPRG